MPEPIPPAPELRIPCIIPRIIDCIISGIMAQLMALEEPGMPGAAAAAPVAPIAPGKAGASPAGWCAEWSWTSEVWA
jgi:hypothetical protein